MAAEGVMPNRSAFRSMSFHSSLEKRIERAVVSPLGCLRVGRFEAGTSRR
jgi:hypothetical protein